MAELSTARYTLPDLAKTLDPDGSVGACAEILSQVNSALEDIPYFEGNLMTGHRTNVETGLPSVSWRLLNQGVAASKHTTAQLEFTCGELKAWMNIDKALADLSGRAEAFRAAKLRRYFEAMAQEKCSTLFYGNETTAPAEFTGLSPHYSDLSAGNAQNIIDGSGSGSDNSSIWLVGWGANKIYGIYPRGSKIGLQHKNHGEKVIQNPNGTANEFMTAYLDEVTWNCGLVVEDWRYAVRIANIDISDLLAGSGADLNDLMITAYHRFEGIAGAPDVTPVVYMNRTVFQEYDRQCRNDVVSGGGLDYENVNGKRIAMFRDMPIRIVDSLTETESQVT